MRMYLLYALSAIVLSSGCQMYQNKTHSGCGFWWYTPASIDTSTPVLVNAPQTAGTAHPMGSAAGPVSEGSYTHAPTVPIAPMPMPRAGAQIGTCGPCGPDCGPPRLTVQEFKEMANTINGRPMPVPTIKEGQ